MPKPEAVQKALEAISKRGVNYEYFFDHLSSPEWIDPLFKEGMFQHPLPPKREGDYISFPFWPESRYLARMARQAPTVVLGVALKIPKTDNVRVYDDLADIALAMPPELGVKLVPQLETGLESRYHSLLPEKLGTLMAHLAAGGEVDAALDLARALLSVSPDPRVAREGSSPESIVFRPSPQAHFDTWQYGEILKKDVPTLVESAGVRALILLCDLLENALQLSERPGESGTPRDCSFIWRPAIETDSEPPVELKDMLVSAVRDAAESLMNTQGKGVLGIVEARRFKVFQRMGLHLRRRWPEADPEGTAARVSNQVVFDDVDLQHELFHLLRERFGELPEKTREAYLALVERGPDVDRWVGSIQKSRGQTPSEEQMAASVRHWQYSKLFPIQADLDGKWQERFDALKGEFREPEHPDYPYYAHPAWTGPTSPKGADELGEMSIGEIIAFLDSWRPSGEWQSPTPDGLSGVLQRLVASQPERFAPNAEQFRGLDPTYVRGLLMGVEEAAKQGKVFSWLPVLTLCSWVVEQPRELPDRMTEYTDLDPGWVWTRKAIADLLSQGFEPGAASIPFGLRCIAWEVLRPLTDDPEPTPEYEASYGGSIMDPATISINTIRGEAMHAVVRYALWVMRGLEETSQETKYLARGFEEMPEVRGVLDCHLNLECDPALAIRAVYGQCFPWLFLLDGQWAAQNVARIFPSDEALRDFRDTAWETYIAFSAPYDDVLPVLSEQYAAAIERIGTASASKKYLADPDECLAGHLMVFFWRGRLSLNDPDGLLSRFYDKAHDVLCAHALSFVGMRLKRSLSPEVTERLKSLWAWRLSVARGAASPLSHAGEMAAFGWWFASGMFDDAWAISQLREALGLAGSAEPEHKVVEHLAALSAQVPLDAVECLDLMVGNHPQFYRWRKHLRAILLAALHSDNSKAKQVAEDLSNRLGAMGYLEYRDLLVGHG